MNRVDMLEDTFLSHGNEIKDEDETIIPTTGTQGWVI